MMNREGSFGLESSENLTSIYDYDGQEYKIDSSLIGADCPFGGKNEEFNAELLTALREKWMNSDGSLTESGQKELGRRTMILTEYEKEQQAARAQRQKDRTDKQKSREKKDLDDKKSMVEEVLASVGYDGGWKLRADRRSSDGYYIMFKETKGQIEEGKVIIQPSFDDLLETIRTELPKMLK